MAPFVGLTLLVGLVVSAVASQQLATSGAQQLDLLAVREQDNVNTVFNSVEEQQLSDLRLLAATTGVADAVQRHDAPGLGKLLLPLVANHLPERLEVVVIDADGNNLLAVQADPQHPDQCLCVTAAGKASYEHLDDVLGAKADKFGTRYVGLVPSASTWLLYTVGPVIDANGYLTGAILVGETLDQVTALVQDRAQVELELFTTDGRPLGATKNVDFPIPSLSATESASIVHDGTVVSKRVTSGAHHAAIFYVPWILRFETRGYASLVVPADPIAAAQNFVLLVILIVCVSALFLTLIVGSIVSRSVARPMGELKKAMSEVASGHLEYRADIGSRDEFGHLAESFNAMTQMLRERTLRLETLTDETLLALAAAIDARDPYTHGHSMRVAVYAEALAVLSGFERREREALKRACMLHDIGKIGVPDSVLRKEAPLDERERAEMRQHTLVGHRLVSGLPWDKLVLDVVLHHHERWDGKGYPARLDGAAIPPAARVVAIADTLDAMTSPRPYRPAFTYRRAADEIIAQAGLQFDPALVTLFTANRREFGSLVRKTLHVWVPKVIRTRRRRRLTAGDSESLLKVVSS